MKRIVIILFVALLGLSWFSAFSEAVNNPKKLREHLEKAAELEEKEIYVDAIEEYKSALEYDPDNVEIYIKMARAALNTGDDSEFVSICEEIAENYQDNTEALDMLMDYYIENEYEDRAAEYLQSFVEKYPENENAQNWFVKFEGTYTELYSRYDELGEIVNDSIVVMRDGMYGIADAEGKEIIAPEYKELYPFSADGFALTKKEDGTWKYIDKDGQTRKVPDENYESMGMLSEERVTACKDGKYGYLDEELEPVSEFEWDSLTAVAEDTGAGEKDGQWMLVDKDGEVKNDKRYAGIIADENGFCTNQERVFVKEGNTYHIINTKGKEIGDLTFEDAKAFTSDGYAAVCNQGKWGFADEDGKLVIDYMYEDAQSFQNGYAAVCVDGLWGYIDEDGNQIIEPTFTEATHFSEIGTAAVKLDNQDGEEWSLIQLILFR